MTQQQLLEFCEWLFLKNNKELTFTQKEVLRQALAGGKLKDILIQGYSSRYIEGVLAQKLWKTLGEFLNCKVGMKSLPTVLEEQYRLLSEQDLRQIRQFSKKSADSRPERTQFLRIVVKQKLEAKAEVAEHILENENPFYPRPEDARIFFQALNNEQLSQICLHGLGGTGKTAFVHDVLKMWRSQHPTTIVWIDLKCPFSFDIIEQALEDYFQEKTEQKQPFSSILDYIVKESVVLVFDHWESLFETGGLAGQYQAKYQEYEKFIAQVVTQKTCGKIIILSQELSPCIESYPHKYSTAEVINLNGLPEESAKCILEEYDLSDRDSWPNFVKTYRGNPLSLRVLGNTIQTWFQGSIKTFAEQRTVICGETLGDILANQLERLTNEETEILYWLMLFGRDVSLLELQDQLEDVMSKSDVFNSVKSLMRRSLLERLTNETRDEAQYYLSLQPSIQRYFLLNFARSVAKEIQKAIAQGSSVLESIRYYQLFPNGTHTVRADAPVVILICQHLSHLFKRNSLRLIQQIETLRDEVRDDHTSSSRSAIANLEIIITELRHLLNNEALQ